MKRAALKEAYVQAVEATVELEKARHMISELNYRIEEVENSKFLLDNVGRWAEPSDDAHEVLFERVRRAEAELEKLLGDNIIPGIKASLMRAQKIAFDSANSVEKA